MIKLVMYDLDGTLIDTASEIAEALNLTLVEFGAETVDEWRVRAWIGHGAVKLIEEAWQTMEPDITLDVMMATFTRHYHDTVGKSSQPYPYVIETLRQVKALGIKQAVITNKESSFTKRVLAMHGLDDFFDLVISGDTLPVRKPDPAVIQHCMNTLNVTAEASLFVGDSDIDVATAKGAGVQCWAVPYGYNAGRDIKLAGADRLIDDLRAVREILQDKIECEG
ncbi:MAG: HAD family hydrolase [Nitrosomonadales bacterium]|nr:HAD family hydrolase [Nitrosomonadales bacterium]